MAKITYIMAEITFKVAVVTSTVTNITFVVNETTFKVALITSSDNFFSGKVCGDRDHFLLANISFLVTKSTFLVTEIRIKEDYFFSDQEHLRSG